MDLQLQLVKFSLMNSSLMETTAAEIQKLELSVDFISPEQSNQNES